MTNVTIHLANGKDFKVLTHDVNTTNIYIQKIVLNGKIYKKNFISHSDIEQGGLLEFFMGKSPNKNMAGYEKPL